MFGFLLNSPQLQSLLGKRRRSLLSSLIVGPLRALQPRPRITHFYIGRNITSTIRLILFLAKTKIFNRSFSLGKMAGGYGAREGPMQHDLG